MTHPAPASEQSLEVIHMPALIHEIFGLVRGLRYGATEEAQLCVPASGLFGCLRGIVGSELVRQVFLSKLTRSGWTFNDCCLYARFKSASDTSSATPKMSYAEGVSSEELIDAMNGDTIGGTECGKSLMK